MSPKRIKERLEDYRNALGRLIKALDEDPEGKDIVVDATIQRFEFTYELAWKLAKALLAYGGIEAASPRAVIKEAFQAGLIEDGQGWILMLEDRNLTSHIYDESQALKIYGKIKSDYIVLMGKFLEVAKNKARQM